MDWKETVTTVSETVFPGISHKFDDAITGNEVTSNLPLQMGLYFNVIFSPVWLFILILYLVDMYNCFNDFYKFITVTMVTILFLIETLRLYLGYEGNLKDKIPELAGFWMLSILIQFPLQSFLLFNPYFKTNVLEITVQAVMFILLCSELISGYCALKYTARQQAIYFRIMKLKGDITLADIQERYRVQ